mmetsp:Transcript_981/g.1645  ORF Transcript_981/g.1645 Transcript_981/m.1645 type:complete len:113 (+) Transcript_981:12-350(+)
MFDDAEVEEIDIIRPINSGVLAFHNGTEDALFLFLESRIFNDSDASQFSSSELCNHVLKLVDEFCYTRHWMMHIGDEKSQVLSIALFNAKHNQKIMNESSQSKCEFISFLLN